MTSFIGRVGDYASDYSAGAIEAGSTVAQGCLAVAGEMSQVMHDIYSLEGFEKWSKALIADLRFLSLIPAINGVFSELLKTLEAQKDLYYATMFVGSMADFIEHKNGHYRFKLPRIIEIRNGREIDKGIDVVKILLAIGNFFETGKFLQKYKVFSFSLCTHVANHLASIQLFSLNGKTYVLDNIPVLNCLFDKPKDVFVFIASGLEINRCKGKSLRLSDGSLNWELIFKVTGSAGKMMLITFGRHFSKTWWFAVLDVTTQNASLAAFIYKRHKERAKMFHPQTAAPAA